MSHRTVGVESSVVEGSEKGVPEAHAAKGGSVHTVAAVIMSTTGGTVHTVAAVFMSTTGGGVYTVAAVVMYLPNASSCPAINPTHPMCRWTASPPPCSATSWPRCPTGPPCWSAA